MAGVKIALFDVSDVENPKEVDKLEIGERGSDSEALYDHKAFLFDKKRNMLVIPIREVGDRYKTSEYGLTDRITDEIIDAFISDGTFKILPIRCILCLTLAVEATITPLLVLGTSKPSSNALQVSKIWYSLFLYFLNSFLLKLVFKFEW